MHFYNHFNRVFDSLPEILAGRVPKELSELLLGRDAGLFPSPKEISFACSCPDWAHMCKHVAATLYGIGVRLDEDAKLLFTLRGTNADDLVSRTVTTRAESLLEKAVKKSSRIIDDADLSELFGIDLAGSDGLIDPAGSARAAAGTGSVKSRNSKKTDSERGAVIARRKGAGAKKKTLQKPKIRMKRLSLPRKNRD